MLLLFHIVGHSLLVMKQLISLVSGCFRTGAEKRKSRWEMKSQPAAFRGFSLTKIPLM